MVGHISGEPEEGEKDEDFPYIFWARGVPYLMLHSSPPEGHLLMLLRPRKPRLVITEQSPTELNAVCAGCKKAFHAYIRTTKAAAILRLERNFRLHYRLAHRALERPGQAKQNQEFDLPAAS